jgi:hypothetical protein
MKKDNDLSVDELYSIDSGAFGINSKSNGYEVSKR